MIKIEFEGNFDINACNDCPLRAECAAFAFADKVRGNLDSNSGNLPLRFARLLNHLTMNPTDAGREAASQELDIVTRRIDGLLTRSKEVQALTTRVVMLSVESQILPEGQERLEALEVGLTKIMRTKGIKAGDIGVEMLDRIGTDARFHSFTGVCGAIGIEETVQPD